MDTPAIKTIGQEYASYENVSLSNVKKAVNMLIPEAMKEDGALTQKGKDIFELSKKALGLPENVPVRKFARLLKDIEALTVTVNDIATDTNSTTEIRQKLDAFFESLPECLKNIVKRFNVVKSDYRSLLRR